MTELAKDIEPLPISEAPRDGTYVLVNNVAIGGYSAGDWLVANFSYEQWTLGGSCGCNDNPIQPTHFYYLPASPH